jgi:hypothetical protein
MLDIVQLGIAVSASHNDLLESVDTGLNYTPYIQEEDSSFFSFNTATGD